MTGNHDDWRSGRPAGERDIRDLGGHPDYGRAMLDDMRRYARGGPGASGLAMEGPHRGRGPRGYTRSDSHIREDVADRLTDDPHVDASDIEVTVAGGEVTLSGTTDDRMARRRAEDIAESVPGVGHVQNNLRVRTAGTAPPAPDPRGGGSADTGSDTGRDTATTGTVGAINAPADLETVHGNALVRR